MQKEIHQMITEMRETTEELKKETGERDRDRDRKFYILNAIVFPRVGTYLHGKYLTRI